MCELDQYLHGVVKNCSKCNKCAFSHDDGTCFFAYECIYSDFLYFKEKDEGNFLCPLCGAKLSMYESMEEYRDDNTLIITEHYECPECGQMIPTERVATYELRKETWTGEVPQLQN